MTEITNKIYYVGVNDRNKHRFEGLWPLPNGVSYNSYICLLYTSHRKSILATSCSSVRSSL